MKKTMLTSLIAVAVIFVSFSGVVLIADWSLPAATEALSLQATISVPDTIGATQTANAAPSALLTLAPLSLGLFGLLVKPS